MSKQSERKVEKIEISFEEMVNLNGRYMLFVRNNTIISNTRFGIAFRYFIEDSCEKVLDKYNKDVRLIALDNALTDKDSGAVLFSKTGKDYLYDKSGLKNKLKEEEELYEKWKTKKFEVEKVYFVGEYPKQLSDADLKNVKDFVVAQKS